MQRAIDQQSREIRVPVHVAENMKRVQKTARELQQSLGRDATPKEIAEKLGDKTEEDVKNIINYLQSPVSLETPVGDDGENILGDMVEGQNRAYSRGGDECPGAAGRSKRASGDAGRQRAAGYPAEIRAR